MALGERDLCSLGLIPNPGAKLFDFRVNPQCFYRVEVILQLFLSQDNMDIAMAWSTNPKNSVMHVIPGEILLVLLILVSGFRNEMMFCDIGHISLAKITRTIFM